MQYDKDQFIWDVTNEVIALKKHATPEERAKLNILLLSPRSEYQCFYGQITGSCFSKRAAELMQLCCTRYFFVGALGDEDGENPIEKALVHIDGVNGKNLYDRRKRGSKKPVIFSALEIYITRDGALNQNIISYLQNETKKLDIYF